MIKIPQFISTEEIKENSVVNGNVDPKLILPTLISVQDTYLKDLIGRDFYKELCTQINAENVSTDNTDLIEEYIQPYLVNKVISEMVVDANYKIRNKALMVSSSDNAQPLDTDGMNIVQQKYRSIAESYKNSLVEFLNCNRLKYPLYICKENVNQSVNINFGNARRQKNRYL
jgi:hypothetical protein